ncbi:SDR family NAD(P)-dependent oxidoreductase [Rothia nasisuis]|uniref:SDR family NAD(P)-dependent oxidoreductase n=1 Tax=Rothia nasisuis TaxID=2109647 RepID=UPI001F39E0F0|nr:SDR family oxidoreductase [Rothia nasisuis]
MIEWFNISGVSMRQKLALITGASRGIGKETTRTLLAQGYDVIAHSRTPGDWQEGLERAAVENQSKVYFVFATLGEGPIADELWENIDQKIGNRPLDTVIFNAGNAPFGNVKNLSPLELSKLFSLNTVAPYALTPGAIKRLTKPGGQILYIGSGLTRYAYPDLTGYGMTKIALEYLSKNVAFEFGKEGITSNVVAPGVVDTDLNARWLRGNEEATEYTKSTTALRRIASPEDIAQSIYLLLSSKSPTITGQTIDLSFGTNL